jgi:NADH-quinone oxidoreductase subunit J
MELLAQAAEGTAGANTAEVVLFWVFAALAVGAAIAVITLRNIVHGALMLVLNLLAIAGMYLTLESSFLGIIQVLVYAGAIMVLFLFVIMLLGIDRDDLLAETRVVTRVAAVLGGTVLAGALLFAVVGTYTAPASVCGAGVTVEAGQVPCVGLADAYGEDDPSGVAFLGLRMFTRFVWPFQLSALLLTVATIGAVILARRRDLAPEDVDDASLGAGPFGIGPSADTSTEPSAGEHTVAETGVELVGGDTVSVGAEPDPGAAPQGARDAADAAGKDTAADQGGADARRGEG